jgi:hypothetical protein
MPDDRTPVVRRSFLSRLSAGIAGFGASFFAAGGAAAASPPPTQGTWAPARHQQDEWLDQIPGQHRIFFDATSPTGAGEAITFANNYHSANRSGYGLQPADLCVVLCMRHWATPFAYADAVWAKYGAIFSERIHFVDPKTHAPPSVNVYEARDYGMALPNRGLTLSALVQRGAHVAVCDMATRVFAGLVASRIGLASDAVYREFVDGAVANAHFVPAGIVALNRAQERGYTVAHIG